MRYSVVIRYIGMVLLVLAAFMLASAGISYVSNVDSAYTPLIMSSLLTLLMGCFPLIFVPRTDRISQKEAYCIVVGAWVVASIVGMFPYLMWGGEFTLVNAWFESVSGFTTTGASILNDIEALPRGLLFWRMATSWIGGIGVVMFALVILPAIGKSKMMLSNFELSSLAKDNFNLYRTPTVVRIVLSVYVGLTVVTTLLLKLCGMTWFDSVCHAMSACGTCGFSTKNLSIGWYDSLSVELVLIFAMVMAGIHFGLIFATLRRQRNNIFRSEIARTYFAVIGVSALLIGISLWMADIYPNIFASMRSALFHTVSLITTTGFATADCNTWTSFAIMILIFCSVVCACAGSTAGGMKTTTLAVLFSTAISVFRRREHTHFFGRRVNDDAIRNAATILMMYVILFLTGGFLISHMESLPLLTCLYETASAIGTVGLTLGITPNLGIASQIILIVLMYIGRVGGLTLIFSALSGHQGNTARLPKEKITVG